MSQDDRVILEIELEDDEWLRLFVMAHERDITLNKLMELILTEAMGREDAA